jgi:hypothetical protein
MRLDEELDDALQRLPAWTPPADLCRQVVQHIQAHDLGWLMEDRRASAWAPLAGQGLVAAATAAAATWLVSWGVDPYLRLTAVATDALVMQPFPVVWTCAALSLVSAFFFTRRALA